MATATKLTAEQYLAAPPEHDRTELVDGEVVVVNNPKPIHAALQGTIHLELGIWARDGADRGLVLLPTDVVMDEFNVFAPDLLWIAERHRPADLGRVLARVPDLCVEVRSPSTWRYDIGAKKAAYERGGLPELWLVDSVAESVLVYRRSTENSPSFDVALELAAGDAITSPQLPGFELTIGELFSIPF